ncbi:RNA polymerase sigma factor [Paracoccaceae bacterium Fryx2]|nr:RNA polymerase sigma factor [Paracoccaceae bacterium Fryx2]
MLLEAEMPHLRRYALSLTGSLHDADDLVQDCLVRALTRRSQYESGTQLRRWLFTILRNIMIDSHRQRQRRGPHESLTEAHATASHAARQDDHMELIEIVGKLGQVRPCDRAVLRLSVIDGLSQKEIAERMGVAVGTIKSRLSRTRQFLQE